MRKLSIRLLFCALTSVVSFSSCLNEEDSAQDQVPVGLLTFVNAFPETNSLYYNLSSANGRFILNYQSYIRPQLAYAGNRQLTIANPNSSNTLIDTLITIKDSSAYSSFTYGTEKNPKMVLVEDKTTDNLGENAGIRFFNVANGVSNINLFIGNEEHASFENRAIETGILAKQHQTFTAKEGGTFDLKVTDRNGHVLATRSGYTFQKYYYYSIFLTGTAEDTNTPLYIGIVAH